MAESMTPHILNLTVRPMGETELCAPDVHYVPVSEDRVVAFDANTLIAVEISKAQHEALMKEQAPALSGVEGLLFSKRRPKFDLSPDVSCRQLTLHLSDQCNMRCRYCWIEKEVCEDASTCEPSLPPVMTRDIAASALGMFPDDGRDLRIGFFGGEPLMHFGLLMTITEMAQERAKATKCRAVFHVTTNATLVTPVVARFLAEHGFSIIVSCDGTARLHDAARGIGTYAAMRRGLSLLHRAGCSGRIVLRGTWSGAPAEVLARLGELNELCEQGLAAGVALEPVAGATLGAARLRRRVPEREPGVLRRRRAAARRPLHADAPDRHRGACPGGDAAARGAAEAMSSSVPTSTVCRRIRTGET